MKRIYILFIAALAFAACEGPAVGYLVTGNAEYLPNTMTVPLDVDDRPEYSNWVKNDAPFVTGKIEGVLGTQPIYYSIANVKASNGGNADTFMKELTIRGAGVMQVPLRPQSPAGTYVVSVKISNEGHSAVLEDAYTFILQ